MPVSIVASGIDDHKAFIDGLKKKMEDLTKYKSCGMLKNLRTTADEFAEKEPCKYFFSIPAKKGSITESVNVDKGRYAVLVYHDENSNNRLDMAMFGKPTERYGFSNNKYGAFGSKPPFDEAAINIDKPVNITVKLRK